MNLNSNKNTLTIVAVMTFLMLLTRGNHVMTHVALPDASLALLLVGGLLLRKMGWFVFFAVLATAIDFVAAGIDSTQGFCLTAGYWGMLPTYAVMWLAGHWLAKQQDALHPAKYAVAGLVSTLLAFVISTQTYYLFSGRFPAEGVVEAMQHGWEYLPSYMGYTAMYLATFWFVAKAMSRVLPKSALKTA